MIGLDTNVLLRYVAQDDAVQSSRATQIIEYELTEERPVLSALSLWSKPSGCSIAFNL
jgi:predicted nucleic-acid-binding protein